MTGSVRRSLTALLLVAAVVLTGVACSSTDEQFTAPVQINLPDGRQVTVDGTPKRIVTLGGQWTDVALSFGVVPVGYYDSLKQQTGSAPPWFGDRLADSTPIELEGDVVGAVAALEPDLILAPGFASMSGSFENLSKLAPTIDKISGQQVDPWEDMVTLMGTILHQPDKATEIIAGVTAKVHEITTEFPGLRGKTYSFAYLYGSDQISVLGDASDGAAKLFTSLGLTMAPQLIRQSSRAGQPRFQVSTENIPMLSSDLLVMAAQTPALQERMEALPGYRNLRSVRTGAVAMMSTVQINGVNEPSPNSIPYAFEQMRPALAAASQS
ncbi:ABC transporter substrate-binding protein [Gordonia sp. ABSL11-1]|uniref:ABC transporter substrate-binding protein n=1 Tax=Gordonia sp. ABSL11-1 TaxID=3053924 RepID=UPI002572DEFD|nr:ABC transporter substrate-binding protein [Gordonia sp. ABSL11-1]MDL9946660.1 ABC transporter substrate-binding protein [Gordonia sp. ABSL11-1]